MSTVVIAAIVIVVVLALVMVGAAFADRTRGRRIERDLADKPSAPENDPDQG